LFESLSVPGLGSVVAGTALLGFLCGTLGTFAVLRKQSLMGDAISHACLPGLILAFLLFNSKESWALMLGAAISGTIAAMVILGISRFSRVKEDSALAITLSVFFGFGLMLLTWVQRRPDAAQAGLARFLFGQAATLLDRDVWLLAAIAIPCLITVFIFWKHFQLVCFDRSFAQSLGFPVFLIEVLLSLLLVMVIVAGLETVGVVLMSALLVAPAVAARQWTNKLEIMAILAGIFGAFSGIAGAILFAPARGIVWLQFKHWRDSKVLQLDSVLSNLLNLAREHSGKQNGHSMAMLKGISSNPSGVPRSVHKLLEMGLVSEVDKGLYIPTSKGAEYLNEKTSHMGAPLT
jgi:manganese/zinc/iron transport system permease protein